MPPLFFFLNALNSSLPPAFNSVRPEPVEVQLFGQAEHEGLAPPLAVPALVIPLQPAGDRPELAGGDHEEEPEAAVFVELREEELEAAAMQPPVFLHVD